MLTRNRAFSLIEITLVLVIVVAIAGIGIARAGSGGAAYHAKLAAQKIASDMQLAKDQSVYRSATVTIEFDAASDSYTIRGLYADGADIVVDLSVAPYRIDMQAVDIDGGNTVSYSAGDASTESSVMLDMESGGKEFTAPLDADAADPGAAGDAIVRKTDADLK